MYSFPMSKFYELDELFSRRREIICSYYRVRKNPGKSLSKIDDKITDIIFDIIHSNLEDK